jgi:hypothetical protein
VSQLITISEAVRILGLKSRGSLYRKINTKELPSVNTPTGTMLERAGLEDVWASITRTRIDSPRPPGDRGVRARPASASSGGKAVGPVPDFNEERAWHEREKRLLAQLQREEKASQLVYLEDYGQAQKAVALYLSGQIEALPRQIRLQLPHLTLHDEEVIEDLVRRLLNRVADWRLDDGEVDE